MATKQQIPKIAAAIVEFQEEFFKLSNEDGQYVIQHTKEALGLFISAVSARPVVKVNPILKLISGGEQIMIKALDGLKNIAGSGDVFKLDIDHNFVNWGLNKSEISTSDQLVDIYELTRDAMFASMFRSLSDNPEKLVLSQSQIIDFCLVHYARLHQESGATFFLVKKDAKKPAINDNLFVVSVCVSSGGLRVHVYRFGHAYVWHAGNRHRLVAPQLIS